MEQMESSVYAEFKGKVKKLDYSLGVTVNRSSYSQRGEDADYERYTVSPRLTIRRAIHGHTQRVIQFFHLSLELRIYGTLHLFHMRLIVMPIDITVIRERLVMA